MEMKDNIEEINQAVSNIRATIMMRTYERYKIIKILLFSIPLQLVPQFTLFNICKSQSMTRLPVYNFTKGEM